MRYYVCKICGRYTPKKYVDTYYKNIVISRYCKHCWSDIDDLQTDGGALCVYKGYILNLFKYYNK